MTDVYIMSKGQDYFCLQSILNKVSNSRIVFLLDDFSAVIVFIGQRNFQRLCVMSNCAWMSKNLEAIAVETEILLAGPQASDGNALVLSWFFIRL